MMAFGETNVLSNSAIVPNRLAQILDEAFVLLG